MRTISGCRGSLVLLLCGVAMVAGAQQQDPDALFRSSLEDLTEMKISASSFARKTEEIERTPAAITVITSEQIARSAATNIPDLLRMVPGVQVAQMNAATWAVSVRGFNNQFANKVLVMVDGRTVYSETFSGVNWDEIDLPIRDIERIEIVRGPGASVWGTNAVNGVINILTKPARRTIGVDVGAKVSNIMARGSVRYGGALGTSAEFNLGVTGVYRRALLDDAGQRAFDGQRQMRISGRLDWRRTAQDEVEFTGDLYRGSMRTELAQPPAFSGKANEDEALHGGFLLGRWTHRGATESGLQAYYSRQYRQVYAAAGLVDTYDVDFQDHVKLSPSHDVVWGAKYRFTADLCSSANRVTMQCSYFNHLGALFVQDEIRLSSKLTATLGSKVQDGSLSGFQVQPSARLLWTVTPHQTLWAAASHSAAATSIGQTGIDADQIVGSANGLPLIVLLDGNSAIKAEFVESYEGGWRGTLPHHVSFDLASYFNHNTRLNSLQSGTPAFSTEYGPSIVIPTTLVNGYRANTAGVELGLAWKPLPTVDVAAGYTWMQAHLHQTLAGPVSIENPWSSPRNVETLSASWAAPRGWRVSGFLQNVGKLSGSVLTRSSAAPPREVPDYTRLDLHVTHALARRFELDGGATNLLRSWHREFGVNAGMVDSLDVARAFFLKASVVF